MKGANNGQKLNMAAQDRGLAQHLERKAKTEASIERARDELLETIL